MMKFFKHIDLLFILALCFSPLLALRLFSSASESRSIDKAQASATCLKGQCLLLPQEELYFILLPPLTQTMAFEGDQVVTLDEGSEIEVTFPDGAKLIQRNTALIKIQKGRGSLLRDINKDTENFKSTTPSNKDPIQEHSIIYVGDLPVEILQPKPGTEIVSEQRPFELRIVTRIGKKLSQSKKDDPTQIIWQIYRMNASQGKTSLLPVSTFRFMPTSDDDIKDASITLAENGKYLFAPESLDPKIAANGFQLTLSSNAALSEKISDLIDNYDDRKDQPIEIRSQ